MRMMKLAVMNFKGSFKGYLSLVISLAFTILIFLNFQNIIYSDAFAVLGTRNKEFVDIIVQVVSFVLGCFMFFFVWYSTNVFLSKRKKEIGIYVFMGLSNQKIGRMYLIESVMIGLSALFLGLVSGIAVTGLFQMILLALSDLAVEIRFQFTPRPAVITAGVYLVIYGIFMLKGYLNIVRSSVVSMVSATRQNEYVRVNGAVLLIKAALGIGVLGSGYYMAVKDGGQEVMGNVLVAVVLVTVGVYLLFGGLIPFFFQSLAGRKGFLYRGQRTLWINSVIFRMKKNYRTYAMVCVLSLSSVTALATGVAFKYRYDNMVLFDNTYTFQLLSNRSDLEERAVELIENHSEILYSSRLPILFLESQGEGLPAAFSNWALLPYSGVKALAHDTGLSFELEEPGEDEVICTSHLYLLSLLTGKRLGECEIYGKTYTETAVTFVPYLGYLQNMQTYYIVNDREYERLLSQGTQQYTYNYRIADNSAFEAARDSIQELVDNTEENFTARVAVDPGRNEMDWIKVMYSLCIFMFMVFVLASGSIMFMKLYNDAFEEKERFAVLRKLGIQTGTLKKAAARELATAYVTPLLVMAVSSYFSVHALEKMMKTSLLTINLASVLAVSALFFVCYLLSVAVYWQNAGCMEK